jgi:glutaconate CoA-transferase subunit A
VILPALALSAVVCVPQGARPSYAHGYYTRDNAFYIAWDRIARDRKSFLAWIRENVLG